MEDHASEYFDTRPPISSCKSNDWSGAICGFNRNFSMDCFVATNRRELGERVCERDGGEVLTVPG